MKMLNPPSQASSVSYLLLFATSLSASKFVLSTLGFQFPMVFQGWQTLVGFVLYHLLHLFGRVTLTPLDMAGYISLFPYFLLFCSAILTGSMALAKISLPAFLSLSSLVPVTLCLLGHYERRRRSSFVSSRDAVAPSATSVRYQLCASSVVIVCNAILLWLEQPGARHDGYFWMEVHCLCSVGMTLYGKIADARYTSVDRQYYSYIFSLVVLLPASLYLEEAFHALRFQQLYQLYFVLGSLVCAISGVALHFHQTRLRARLERRFGQLHHFSQLTLSLAAMVYFPLELSRPGAALPLAAAASAALMLVPTYLTPEEAFVANPTASDDCEPLMEADDKQDEDVV